jgi:hypothetical protein
VKFAQFSEHKQHWIAAVASLPLYVLERTQLLQPLLVVTQLRYRFLK